MRNSGATLATLPKLPTIPRLNPGTGGGVSSVVMDLIINFSNGTGALTATKLNNGTHGAAFGTWTENTVINYSVIEDHAVELPFDLLVDGDLYNGSEGQGLTFDLSGDPITDDEFIYTFVPDLLSNIVFLLLVKYNTEGGVASYNNDTINITSSNFTVPQRIHTFAGFKGIQAHTEGDLGIAVTDNGNWLIVCGRHNVSGQVGELFVQDLDTMTILGSSESAQPAPAGNAVSMKLQSYARGVDQGGGDIKVKLLALCASDITWPPYSITVPPPTSVAFTQTDIDEGELTWDSTCQIFDIQRNLNGAGFVDLQLGFNNNNVYVLTDTDLSDGDTVKYRILTVIGSQSSEWVESNEVEIDNGPFAPPTFTQNIDPATTDTDETFAAALRQAWTYSGPTGSCVRLGVWCRNFNFAADVKVAIFDSSNNLLGQGVITSAESSSGAWVDVVVASPFTLNNGTAIKTGAMASSAGIQFGYDNGTGSMYYDFVTTYAAFPPNPYTGVDATVATAAFRIGVI